MAVPVVLVTAGARPVTAVESGGFPMTPVDTLGEPVTLVDAGGEPITLINEDGSPAFLAYSAKEYLNGIAPYHWFDFINDRCLYASNDVGGVSGATGYSFARASTGYYQNADGTLTNFASGALRRGNRGVLIEGARTNLLLRSQEFGTTWTLANATISSDQTAAPDGTTTADKLVSAVGTNGQLIQQGLTTTNANAHSFSVFVKAAGFTFARIRAVEGTPFVNAVSIDVNLSNGATVRTNASGVATLNSSSVTALANGWYRVTLSYTLGGASATSIGQVHLNNGADSFNITGDGTSGVFVWGAQLEAAAFPSSYIPTTTASATRAADALFCTAGVSYPLTLWSEFERPQLNGSVDYLPGVNNGGAPNSAQMFITAAGLLRTTVDVASVRQADLTIASPSVVANTVHKAAARAATNDIRSVLNATLSTADTLATMPPNPTSIDFAASPLFGYLRRFAVINSALSDANLQTVTT